jgi:hypothetical protein
MNSAFIVTSALFTNLGIFNTETRIKQTNRTLRSIQEYAPNSKIIFIEGGEKSDDAYLNEFLKKVKSKVFLFGISNELGTPTNLGPSKSLNDVVLTRNAIQAVLKSKIKVDRIFRISGRYQLSPNFDINVYNDEKIIDKHVLKIKKESYIPNSQIKYYHESRLWSFPYSKITKTLEYIDLMINDLIYAFKNNEYLDFEHVLYKNIPESEIFELDLIHVFGVVTSNGYIVYD